MSDRVDQRSRWTAVGMLTLSVLFAGCGEIADLGDASADSAMPQMSIEDIVAALQAATPNPVTPEAVAETFALGTNATDVQREIMKQELVGSVVEWDLVVYDVRLLDGGQYQVTSQPVQIQSPAPLQHVAVVVLIQSQGPADDAFLRSVKTDEPIRIRGLVQDVFLRSIVRIAPGVVVRQTAVPVAGLSEEAFLQYVTTPMEKYEAPGTRTHLGDLNGTPVVADFVCSDLCPPYMVRVVHFQLREGQSCAAAGGVVKLLTVTMGIALMPQPFCLPKLLIDHWDQYESGPLHGRGPPLEDVPEGGVSEAPLLHLDQVTPGKSTERGVRSWENRAVDVMLRVNTGALETIPGNVQTFASLKKAQSFSENVSSDDPARFTNGKRLEASQTWFHLPTEPFDVLGLVLIHVVNRSSKAITGLLFELAEGRCEAPGRLRSYHVIITRTAIATLDEHVIVAEIPPTYLARDDQCGTILEAW